MHKFKLPKGSLVRKNQRVRVRQAVKEGRHETETKGPQDGTEKEAVSTLRVRGPRIADVVPAPESSQSLSACRKRSVPQAPHFAKFH